MPVSVVIAAALQFLLAATFLVIPVVAYRYGVGAQQAAEAEVVRQGFPVAVLEQHRVKIKESGAEMVLPVAISVCLAAVASLNLAGIGVGRILSWIFAAILLTAGGFITASQVFVARYVEAAFRKSSDTTVRGIDARAVVRVASDAFPAWLRPVILVRFALTTLGSALVIVLLATTDAHFE